MGKKKRYAHSTEPFLSDAMEIFFTDGKMSEKQFIIPEECLWEKVLQPGTKPRFKNQGFRDELLHLESTDEVAVKWFQ